MRELNEFFLWLSSFNRPDPQLASVTEWLELENREAMIRGGRSFARVLYGVLGFFAGFFLVAGIAVDLGHTHAMHLSNPAAVEIGVGTLLTALFCGTAFGKFLPRILLNRRTPVRSDRSADSLRAIAQLRNIHGYRGLRRELGEHGITEITEGAQLYLRCRSLLTSETWVSSADTDPWAEARDNMLDAMQAAMDRLALYVVKKRSFSEIGPVLEEMRMATNEAERITRQRSSSAGSAGQDLRASLARMKELAEAEQELLRMRVE